MSNQKEKRRRGMAAPWVCSAILLLGFGADRLLSARAVADAQRYHARVREALGQVPRLMDDWTSKDTEVPQGAVKLLKPNVILSRRFTEFGSGRSVTLLVVHCQDARDILGHFPPVCYVQQGWTPISRSPRDWGVAGMTIQGTQYRFRRPEQLDGEVVIDNFMILPGGKTARDMDDVEESAKHWTLKHFGAGQVQLIYDPHLTEQDRQEIFSLLLSQAQPLLAAMMHPVEEVSP
jgi:hypothetical protein